MGKTGILVIIVAAQFMGTSLWFAGNAVIDGLVRDLGIPPSSLGPVTSAVQIGFILGTLVYAILTIADRFSPSRVFFVSSVLGGLANAVLLIQPEGLGAVLAARGLTGFFLAGIYPVGMKIAADHFPEGLGKALGFLLGALVVGTASPHLVRYVLVDLSWQSVIATTSLAASTGGVAVLFLVPDGPGRKRARGVDLRAFFRVFQSRDVRSAAFGYFGHMWELYAFWAFVPVVIAALLKSGTAAHVALWSFGVIAVGALTCVWGGYTSLRKGSARVAVLALITSMLCCLVSPLILHIPAVFGMLILFIWGLSVIPDSPQFSTLVARFSKPEMTGTALTIVNCTGFTISVISIQVVNWIVFHYGVEYALLILAPGPLLGLLSMRRLAIEKA